MSELKAYYDHNINQRSIDISRNVIDIIDTQQNTRDMKRLVRLAGFKSRSTRKTLLIATIMVSLFLFGFTIINQLTFSDKNENLWQVIFNGDRPRSLELWNESMSNEGLLWGDDFWMLFYDNDGGSKIELLTHPLSPEVHQNIEITNDYLSEFIQLSLGTNILGLDYVTSTIYRDVEDQSIYDLIVDLTPLDEYSYFLMLPNQELTFQSSNPSIELATLPSIDFEIREIEYRYGQADDGVTDSDNDYVSITFNKNPADILFAGEDYQDSNNEKLIIGEHEVWLRSYELGVEPMQVIEFTYMEDHVVTTMLVHSKDISLEDATEAYGELLMEIYP